MPLRDLIRTLLNLPTRLTHTSSRIVQAQRSLPSNLGTWLCHCGHINTIFHLPSHPHPLGILACRACASTFHPSYPITRSPRSRLQVEILAPVVQDAFVHLPAPRSGAASAGEDGGYGYVCLNEHCGLTWDTAVREEWWRGRSRRVLCVGGRRWKRSCLCGMRVCEGGLYAVFEVVPTRVGAHAGAAVGEQGAMGDSAEDVNAVVGKVESGSVEDVFGVVEGQDGLIWAGDGN